MLRSALPVLQGPGSCWRRPELQLREPRGGWEVWGPAGTQCGCWEALHPLPLARAASARRPGWGPSQTSTDLGLARPRLPASGGRGSLSFQEPSGASSGQDQTPKAWRCLGVKHVATGPQGARGGFATLSAYEGFPANSDVTRRSSLWFGPLVSR